MCSYVKLVIALHVMLAAGAPNPTLFADVDEQKYLTSFGYLQETDTQETASLRTLDHLINAVKELQRYAGIPVTGKFDERTKELMKAPRCGMPDQGDQVSSRSRNYHEGNRRQKRYLIHGQKWGHHNLTWSLRSWDLDRGLSTGGVRRALTRALDLWAKNSRLTFEEVNSNTADILVSFERGRHGDDYPFDGRGQILAHAFFPGPDRGGDAHFDKDENWILDDHDDTKDGTSLYAVAAHEFGHSLGLAHSSEKGALMYPWYQGLSENFELPYDDKIGIQQNYGSPDQGKQWGRIPPTHRTYPHLPRWTPPATTTTTTTTTTTQRPRSGNHPNQGPYNPRYPPDCNPNQQHYRNRCPYPTPGKGTRAPTRPRYWPTTPAPRKSDVPDTCDTSYDAITFIRRELYIFKGRYFWRIGKHGVYEGFPTEIHRFFQLPADEDHIDAAYERPKDKKIVFFVGNKYYLFNGNQREPGYPRPLTDLGLPYTLQKIDGALIWGHNGLTYLFSGHEYWRFDEDERRVDLDYPRDMSMFAGVDYNIDAVFQWKNGKTYFFKGKGYWEFDDLRMRVAHEKRKLSAPFFMGCPEVPDVEGDVDTNHPRRDRVISAGHRSPIVPLSGLLATAVLLRLS